jgi:hypothetical protein
MEKPFTGWRFRVSEFCFFFLFFGFFFFCQVWLQQESILFGLLKVSQACMELADNGLVGRWRWPVGQQVAGSGTQQSGGQQVGSSGSQQQAGRQWQCGSGHSPVLSVYWYMEKTSTG